MTLKEARKKCGGLTQKELADKLGVTGATVVNWEKGHTTPSIEMCLKLSKVFGISIADLDLE